ncbi:hypothetical protein KC19_VG216800 [Ceratodon purpureus]|uniref:Uncharacterized protein n=1 Tax=Ceratodon purpureus TaxID=3225 RepID=A0A8T0HSZ6_CERPU|nr:hypothetical protein KC19_VG216800 [Ceratodon purpureus]
MSAHCCSHSPTRFLLSPSLALSSLSTSLSAILHTRYVRNPSSINML